MAKKSYIELEIWPYAEHTAEVIRTKMIEGGFPTTRVILLHSGLGDPNDAEKSFSPDSEAKACVVHVDEMEVSKVTEILNKQCPGTSFRSRPLTIVRQDGILGQILRFEKKGRATWAIAEWPDNEDLSKHAMSSLKINKTNQFVVLFDGTKIDASSLAAERWDMI